MNWSKLRYSATIAVSYNSEGHGRDRLIFVCVMASVSVRIYAVWRQWTGDDQQRRRMQGMTWWMTPLRVTSPPGPAADAAKSRDSTRNEPPLDTTFSCRAALVFASCSRNRHQCVNYCQGRGRKFRFAGTKCSPAWEITQSWHSVECQASLSNILDDASNSCLGLQVACPRPWLLAQYIHVKFRVKSSVGEAGFRCWWKYAIADAEYSDPFGCVTSIRKRPFSKFSPQGVISNSMGSYIVLVLWQIWNAVTIA